MKKFFNIALVTALGATLASNSVCAQGLSEETKRTLVHMEDKGYRILIMPGFNYDDAFIPIKIDSLLTYGPLSVNSVSIVWIVTDCPTSLVKMKTRKGYRNGHDLLAGEYFKRQKYDRFGNLVSHIVHGTKEYAEFGIRPNSTNAVSIDLSPMGIDGELVNFLKAPVAHPANLEGKQALKFELQEIWNKEQFESYTVFVDDGIIQQVVEKMITAYLNGVKDVEDLFGLKYGEIVKQIRFGRVSEYNGLMPFNLSLELLLDGYPRDDFFDNEAACVVARHETFHLIDKHLQISTDSLWKRVYEKVGGEEPVVPLFLFSQESNDFFDALKEDGFGPNEKGCGGHPQDGSDEFLASFLNSLMHKQWKNIMEIKSDDFKEKYLRVASVLYEIAENRDNLRDTSLPHLLKRRIVWFEDHGFCNK